MPPTENELTLTRVLPASCEEVFKAWTEERQAAWWWSPEDFKNIVCELEPRTGGSLYMEMQGPDGTVYPMTGLYREVVAPTRLVFTCAPLEKGREIFEVLHILDLSGDKSLTSLTLRAKVIKTTPEASQYLEGMSEGWRQTLHKLEAYLASVTGS